MNLRSLFMLLTVLPVAAVAEEQRLYFGTYSRGDSTSEGIYTCLFEVDSGKFTEPELAAKADNPSFLAIHQSRDVVYACNETADFEGESTGAVSAFRIDRATGQLKLLNQLPTGGAAPCHCVIDSTGKYLLLANYTGGNAAVFSIAEDGRLLERTCLINHVGSGPNQQRQKSPHAHSINLSADNRFAYVADLGVDRVMIYRFDDQRGLLIPNSPDSVAVRPGGGPRHFSLHPSGQFAYSNNELTSEVNVFQRNASSGGLTHTQTISTLPEDYDGRRSTAECLVHPSGEFAYVSNRGHDSIAVYRIDPKNGELSLVEIEHTAGREPRNFFIHPAGKWLIAANQNSDTVVVFDIDETTGGLSLSSSRISVGKPVCVRLLPSRDH